MKPSRVNDHVEVAFVAAVLCTFGSCRMSQLSNHLSFNLFTSSIGILSSNHHSHHCCTPSMFLGSLPRPKRFLASQSALSQSKRPQFQRPTSIPSHLSRATQPLQSLSAPLPTSNDPAIPTYVITVDMTPSPRSSCYAPTPSTCHYSSETLSTRLCTTTAKVRS